MKGFIIKGMAIVTTLALLSGCARDLSSDMYVSSSTLNLTLEGKVLAVRAVKVRDDEKRLTDNTGGMLAGGALGAVTGSAIGKGAGNTAAIVGLGLAGAAAGALVQSKLGESSGYEFTIKVDTSKMKDHYYEGNAAMRNVISTAITSGLVTVVQKDNPGLGQGSHVYVIYSDNRTRVIPAN